MTCHVTFMFQVYTDSIAGVWEFGTTTTVGLILIILFHNAVETFSWVSYIVTLFLIIIDINNYFEDSR